MTEERIYRRVLTVSEDSIDVQGHVNNREYLRWMEEAAIEHATSFGWDVESLRRSRRGWVARKHWLEYLRPCFAGDQVEVFTWLQSASGATCLRRYAIRRNAQELAAIGATEWVFVDAETGRPTHIRSEGRLDFTVCLTPPDDPKLVSLGVARELRFTPSARLLGGDHGAS